jgi:hypothetical protein
VRLAVPRVSGVSDLLNPRYKCRAIAPDDPEFTTATWTGIDCVTVFMWAKEDLTALAHPCSVIAHPAARSA